MNSQVPMTSIWSFHRWGVQILGDLSCGDVVAGLGPSRGDGITVYTDILVRYDPALERGLRLEIIQIWHNWGFFSPHLPPYWV